MVALGDAVQAMKLLQSDTAFDLIISDYEMPHMNGGEFLRALKGDHRTSHIPFLLISGRIDDDELVEMCRKGRVTFTSKWRFHFYEEIPRLLSS